MPTNVEIKARIHDWPRQCGMAEALAEGPVEILDQDDTFYRVQQGRLKLRDLGDGNGELIHYERPDCLGPKSSRYRVVPTRQPAALRAVLERALGLLGRVQKVRRLYFHGQTRIHLDEVAGLGKYIELEVVMTEGQSAGSGQWIAEDLCGKLDIRPQDLVAGAYLDLILARAGSQ
jgi:adenylate cyclase class IV